MPSRRSHLTAVLVAVVLCLLVVGLACCGGTTVQLGPASSVGKVDPSLPPTQQVLGAAMRGDLPTLKALVEADAGLANAWDETSGRSALHCAVESADEATVRFLLDKGADPFVIDNDEQTPLARAEEVRAPENVRLLLRDAMNAQRLAGAGQH